ncbi:MAG: aminodeoxychorismate/anthranilate synthase component II [Archaeoglobaceae archaeon]
MIVVIDNRDSFVWNLAEYVSMFSRVKVVPNSVSLSEIKRLNPDGLIISPGPGAPWKERDVGVSARVFELQLPTLGVCLGHQIIAHVFGGKVGRVEPVHGKASLIEHDGEGIFRGVANPLRAGRYHSLAVLKPPRGFAVSARLAGDGMIMGLRSRDGSIEGVQFHPESILTPREEGLKIIGNFVSHVREGLRNQER